VSCPSKDSDFSVSQTANHAIPEITLPKVELPLKEMPLRQEAILPEWVIPVISLLVIALLGILFYHCFLQKRRQPCRKAAKRVRNLLQIRRQTLDTPPILKSGPACSLDTPPISKSGTASSSSDNGQPSPPTKQVVTVQIHAPPPSPSSQQPTGKSNVEKPLSFVVRQGLNNFARDMTAAFRPSRNSTDLYQNGDFFELADTSRDYPPKKEVGPATQQSTLIDLSQEDDTNQLLTVENENFCSNDQAAEVDDVPKDRPSDLSSTSSETSSCKGTTETADNNPSVVQSRQDHFDSQDAIALESSDSRVHICKVLETLDKSCDEITAQLRSMTSQDIAFEAKVNLSTTGDANSTGTIPKVLITKEQRKALKELKKAEIERKKMECAKNNPYGTRNKSKPL